MKEVIRVLDLKTKEGIYLLDTEEDNLHLKEACFYLDKKTNQMSDEEFIEWIKLKMKTGIYMNENRFELKEDIYQRFPFLIKIFEANYLVPAMDLVLAMLIDANGLRNNN